MLHNKTGDDSNACNNNILHTLYDTDALNSIAKLIVPVSVGKLIFKLIIS